MHDWPGKPGTAFFKGKDKAGKAETAETGRNGGNKQKQVEMSSKSLS